ncbi:GreA/GreB family elongation factor [Patescibacteria group bacterium]|nr:GreA/GreB family elongation factor [Patescibacteria group bacterium]
MPNKTDLIEKVIESLERDKASAEAGLASAREGAKEAPSAMESHSDTTRSQMQHLAENLEKDIQEKESGIMALGDFKTSVGPAKGDVSVGSVVSITDEAERRFIYFILPAGGGTKVETDGASITVLSSTAPLAQALIGKRAGETVSFSAGAKVRMLKIIGIE